MSFNYNITPGRPPLLWSDVNDAFDKINENFDSLVATIGDGSGLVPIDFSTLNTNISPATDNLYTLGEIGTRRWKSLFLNEYGLTGTDTTNGIYIGTAQIKGQNGVIDLPVGSTVDGELIKDPSRVFFRAVQVDNNNIIEPTLLTNELNLLSGFGINLSVDSGSEAITVTNTGILSISPGFGTLVSTVSGNSTIINDGVRSLQSTSALPSGRTAGAGINISATKGDDIRITNTGIIALQNGLGITVTTEASTGIAEINVNPAVVPLSAFTRIHIDGDSAANDLLADSVSDALNISAGYGINLSNNPLNDTLTITFNNEVDIVGSIFADNSTLLVDGVNGLIPASVVQGTFTGGVVGNVTGNLTGNVVGNVTGNTTGYHTGDIKGSVFGDNSSKIVDAVENKVYADFFGNLVGNVTGNVTGSAGSATVASTIDITNTNGLTTVYYPTFVENRTTGQTVRADVDLTYRTDTNTLTAPAFAGNLTGTVTGNIFTNLIDSADSSQIVVTPLMRFSSDVVVENEVFVRGSKIVLLDSLKSIVAASTDFADFQIRIAALV